MSVYSWRLAKGKKVLEIFAADPTTREIKKTLTLTLAKQVTEEWAVRYMELNYPHERPVDKKADAEDRG